MRVFDDWKSFLHAILGAIAMALGLFSFKPLAIAIAAAYAAYETLTSQTFKEFLGDVIEFLCGCLAVSMLWVVVYG